MASYKKFDLCVFIGRMQPPHKAHIQNIRQALDLAQHALVVLGSAKCARNVRNPFTPGEREIMIRSCFSKEENLRISVKGIRDYYYNDNAWIANVQQIVRETIEEANLPGSSRIVLLGRYKDSSSYYLNLFPQWKREEVPFASKLLNATDVRAEYFGGEEYPGWYDGVTDYEKEPIDAAVSNFLENWAKTPAYALLRDEWKFIEDYKQMWASAPYPVTFSTTDAVCVKAGHVLMVRRRFNPGKGLLALPGGFLKQDLYVIDSALEELKEETRIKIPKEELLKHLKDDKVFDHPNRSLRGRTVTHAFYFQLPPGGELPQVRGDDDAERALWVPITELFAREHEVYEDHIHIVNYFYSKPR